MSGGVSIAINQWLTFLSNLMTRAGRTAVATYNPQVSQERAYELQLALAGSVTASMTVSSETLHHNPMFTASSRASDRKERRYHFTTHFASSESKYDEMRAQTPSSESQLRVGGSLQYSSGFGPADINVLRAEEGEK
jgi:hypothetical protein